MSVADRKLETGIPGGVCGVYAIISPSGKAYIGSSVDIRRRWYEHHWRMKNGQSSSPQLDRAYAKYGLGLRFEVLEQCGPSEIRDREQFYLDTMRPELNASMDAYCAANWACVLGASRSAGAEARRSPVEDSRGLIHESIAAAAIAMGCSDSLMRRRLAHHDPLPCGTRFRRMGEEWKPLRPEDRKAIALMKSVAERRATGALGHSDKAKAEKSARTRGVPWSDERRARFQAKKAGAA